MELEPEKLSITGEVVSSDILKCIWDDIYSTLIIYYPTAKSLEMPEIKAIITHKREFKRVKRKLLKSKHIIDHSLSEWGIEADMIKASAFVFKADTGWIIVKRVGYYSLEKDLKHEFLHICEDLLCLNYGILTSNDLLLREINK